MVRHVVTSTILLGVWSLPHPPSTPPAIQTSTHLHFVLEYCEGGELYGLLNSIGKKRLKEAHVMFYAAEVLLGLQQLHLLGVVYRDLKPENILLHHTGHVLLTDFDLSYAKGHTEPTIARVAGSKPAKAREGGGLDLGITKMC